MARYTSRFFSELQAPSLESARRVVPVVLELYPATSVCDLGCGVGAWLKAFDENGVHDFLGFDGDYVDRAQLDISPDRFRPHDLSRPVSVPRRFDLAMSLEVAEHLPSSAARDFVGSLVSLAPVVLFSAAIPNQAGTGHINEQWADYWAALFAERGYVAIDAIRPRIWQDRAICWWYRQNILLYGEAELVKKTPRLQQEAMRTQSTMLSIVHPDCFQSLSFRRLLSIGPRTLIAAARRKLRAI